MTPPLRTVARATVPPKPATKRPPQAWLSLTIAMVVTAGTGTTVAFSAIGSPVPHWVLDGLTMVTVGTWVGYVVNRAKCQAVVRTEGLEQKIMNWCAYLERGVSMKVYSDAYLDGAVGQQPADREVTLSLVKPDQTG